MPTFDNLPDWLAHLETAHPVGIDMGLARIDAAGRAAPLYRERLSPSLWTLLSAAVAAPMVSLVFVPLDATVAQAQALMERRFVTVAEPAVPELARLSRAMNEVVQRLKSLFEEQSAQVEQLRQQAHCDPLTGLSHRTHFMAQLRTTVAAEEGPGDGGDGDGLAQPRADPAAPLPAARDPGGRRGDRGERRRRRPLPRLSRALRRPVRPPGLGRLRVRRVRDLTERLLGLPFPVVSSLRLPFLALTATAALAASIVLIAFYAPTDADQGLSQRIFYFHVPIALTGYACFAWGAWKALVHLWKRPPGADLESYVAIHQGVIFGSLTLLTGSLWAKISWGVWWSWSDNQLVMFLVLFLFYCAYFMLRYSVDAGPARANMCAVYALFGVVLIPVSFLAIRLAKSFIHPVVFTSNGPQMTGAQFLTFSVALVGMLLLFATLYQIELAGKRLDATLRDLAGDAHAGLIVCHGVADQEVSALQSFQIRG